MGVGQLPIRLLMQSASSLDNAQSLPLKGVLGEEYRRSGKIRGQDQPRKFNTREK